MALDLKGLLEKYESNSEKIEWIALKDDGDFVEVVMLHSDENDLDAFEVHNLEVDGFNNSIECLGENCPFCAEGIKTQLKVWIQMVDLGDNNKVKIWSRGITDIKKLLEEIAENGNLNERKYKIKRSGAKGSNKTSYGFYAKAKLKKDELELPVRKTVLGFYVRQVSPEDAVKILSGDFTFKKDKDLLSNDSTAVF